MRKLTVRNFSVIKEAELEFGKITVLIGPQSSGKSLLCKLAYFLGKELVDLAVTSLQDGLSWDMYGREAAKVFFARFPSPYTQADGSLETRIDFKSSHYTISIEWKLNPSEIAFTFSKAFEVAYQDLFSAAFGAVPSASGAFFPGGISRNSRQEGVWIALNTVLSEDAHSLTQVLYVPAGRSFFTNTSKGFALLQNPGVDKITREFATQIQWDGHWKVGLLTSGRGVTDEITRRMAYISRGFVLMDSGVPLFLTDKGHKIPLEILSTGVQELVPLFNILEQLMFLREHNFEYSRANFDPPKLERPIESKPLIYLEEPEANIFPDAQYQLVQLISRLSTDPILKFSWVITTHSPYLLSAFNELLKAGQVARERPERAAEIEKIIPREYWISPGDVAAYAFNGKDGILRSMIDPETGLINGDTLDDVSSTIGKEFEDLLEIQYGS
jgi:hypothetical protein